MSFLGIGKKEGALSIVKKMRQQGVSDAQIIQGMQKEGYSPQDIHDALSKADMQTNSNGLPDLGADDVPALPRDDSMNIPSQLSSPPPSPVPKPNRSALKEEQQLQSYNTEEMKDVIEEISESIIEEKWDELLKDINKIVEWKNKTETRLTALDQQFKDLKGNFDELHKAVISKIGEYDQNILNVGAELKAMEKVFKDVLPVFTNNVQELSNIVNKVKGKK